MRFSARSVFLFAIVLFSSQLAVSESSDDVLIGWTEGSREDGLPVKETVLRWMESVVEDRCDLALGVLQDGVRENGFREFNAAGRELGAVFLITARCDVEGSAVMLGIDPVQIYEDTALIRDMEHFSRPAESVRFDAELLEDPSEVPGFISFFGYFTAAGVKYARGNYRAALEEVGRSLEYLEEVPPETAATAYIMSAMIRMAMQDYPGAIDDLDGALELNPLSVRGHMAKGQLSYYGSGNVRDAMASYSRAIEVDSSYYKPYLLRADLLVQQGRSEEALQDYVRALQLYPGDALTHFTVGIIRYQREEYDSGMEHFSSAIRLDSSMVDAYYGRGLCAMESGDSEQAIEDMEAVLALSSDPAKRNVARQQLELLRD
jgi:hypothetical protein